MTLNELRTQEEKNYAVMLLHQRTSGDVIVLLSSQINIKVHRYFQFTDIDTKCKTWKCEVKYYGKTKNDLSVALAQFQQYLNSDINGYEDGLTFICPRCKGTRLECVENGIYTSEVLNIHKDGDFDYGHINADGEVTGFQCLCCGYELTFNDDDMQDDEPITDVEDVVDWIKNNCQSD